MPVADRHASASPVRPVEVIIEDIAREAGTLALTHFRSLASLPVEKKGHLDLVTEADRQVEALLIARLNQAFPDDGIFGEEGGEIPGTSGRIWVIDPIDGTFNFVRGGQNWAISIGLYENRRPVFGVIHAPVRDLTILGGTRVPARLNGRPIKPLPAFDMSRASTGFSFHPTVSTADRLEAIRFISDDLGISFRLCGAATISLIEVMLGETDGYLSIGDLDLGRDGSASNSRTSRCLKHYRLGSNRTSSKASLCLRRQGVRRQAKAAAADPDDSGLTVGLSRSSSRDAAQAMSRRCVQTVPRTPRAPNCIAVLPTASSRLPHRVSPHH